MNSLLFLGEKDPNRVSVYNAFAGSGLVLSAPLKTEPGPWTVVVQGPKFNLPVIAPYVKKLVKSEAGRPFGKWTGGDFDRDRGFIKASYEYEYEYQLSSLEVISFVFLRHLAVVCDIAVSPYSEAQIVKNGRIWCCPIRFFENGRKRIKFN